MALVVVVVVQAVVLHLPTAVAVLPEIKSVLLIALNIMDSFDWKHLLAEGIIMAKVVNVLCATMASDYLGFFCYHIILNSTKKIHLNILAVQNVMCVCLCMG